MLTYGNGQIIPSIAGIEKPVIIPLDMTRKEEKQPPPNITLDELQDFRYTGETEKRTQPKNSNNGLIVDFRLCKRLTEPVG